MIDIVPGKVVYQPTDSAFVDYATIVPLTAEEYCALPDEPCPYCGGS